MLFLSSCIFHTYTCCLEVSRIYSNKAEIGNFPLLSAIFDWQHMSFTHAQNIKGRWMQWRLKTHIAYKMTQTKMKSYGWDKVYNPMNPFYWMEQRKRGKIAFMSGLNALDAISDHPDGYNIPFNNPTSFSSTIESDLSLFSISTSVSRHKRPHASGKRDCFPQNYFFDPRFM